MNAVARPLRILHVIDSGGVYGAESVMLDLCAEHRRMGQMPVIVSIGTTHDDEKPLESAARGRGLEVRTVRMTPGPNLRGALQLLRVARDEDADVIHTHGYKGDILLGFLPKWWRAIPLVATVHGYTDVSLLDRLALYNRLDRLALRRVDRVVLVHQGIASKPGLNHLRQRRCRIIENGIQPRESYPSAPRLDSEILRMCTHRSPVIGAVGRLSREKGFDILLRAVSEVLPHFGDALVLILGEGEERTALEQLSFRLGIADRVLMPGYVSNARDYFQLFHVFVLPSLTEGLPITLLEAMRAGVPVVATKVGGVPHALDEGHGGLLVDPGEPRPLAEAIRRCVGDRPLALRLAAHSTTQSLTRFSSEAMAKGYLELYREVVGSG